MAVPVPTNFKQPTDLEAHDGSTDPQEHLEGFRAAMLLSSILNMIMCRAFSLILKKADRRWFIGLPKNFISQFWQLADQFLAHFATSKAYKKTSTSLINIRWGLGESLKSYMARFNQATLEIKDLPQAIAMHSILVNLKSRDFSKSLAKWLA